MKNKLNINFEYVAKNLSIKAIKYFISILEKELTVKQIKQNERRINRITENS